MNEGVRNTWHRRQQVPGHTLAASLNNGDEGKSFFK